MALSIDAHSDSHPMMEINTTPLIDVLLVLLIMFIIALPTMTHAIKLNMQSGATGEPPPIVDVFVEFDGAVVWNGDVVSTRAELETKARAAARMSPQPHLNVHADRRAQYDNVAHVLGIAQRSGIRQIGIVGQ